MKHSLLLIGGSCLWLNIHSIFFFKDEIHTRVGEMAQQLRELIALPQVLSIVPSNHL